MARTRSLPSDLYFFGGPDRYIFVGAIVFSGSGHLSDLSKNIKLQHIDYTLPGVFEENHYKSAVNGSLWTLPIEIRCYLMVLIFGVVGGFKHRLWGFLLAVFLIASVATNNLYISKAFLVSDVSDMRMPLIFLLGMSCYINRSKVVIDWRISAAALVMALAFKATFIGIAAFYLFVLNTVLVLGATGQLFRIKVPGDYSYGIYIYGFVVQQCVAHFFPQFTSYPSLLLSIPFSLMLSILSWHFIEGPALKISHAASAKLKNGPTM
jgi:peptidoglycan/LPS O-acetylase OafA/YrhL